MTCETTISVFQKFLALKITYISLQPHFHNKVFCKTTNSFLYTLSWTSVDRRSSRQPKLDRGYQFQYRNNCQYGNQT